MTDTDLSMISSLFAKRFKDSSGIVDLAKAPVQGDPKEHVPTSSISLNMAIGVGGFKRGTVNEIYGPESSGKTTLVLDIIARAQTMFPGRPVAYLDCENAFNPDYAKAIGCDLSENKFKLVQENESEQLLSMAQFFAEMKSSIVVVDSVAAMVPKAQLESNEATDAKMGGNAKFLSTHLPKMVSICKETGTIAIYINQIREKLGVMFGNPETTTGGRALAYYSSLRIRTSIKERIKDDAGEVNGFLIKASVQKNKLGGAPYRDALYPLVFGEGIDGLQDLGDLACSKGVFGEGKGGRYEFQGKKLHGKGAVYDLLRDADVAKAVTDTLWGSL